MGLGYIYNGKRAMLRALLTAGAFRLTYVKLSIQEIIPRYIKSCLFLCLW